MADEVYLQHRFRPPVGATTLLLVRHGASAPAREGEPFPMAGGHGDPPLSEEGARQAERLAARLVREPIDAIYVTSLRRTLQTAAPLAAALGLHPRVEPDLREVQLGEWEGGVFRIRVARGDPLVPRIHAEERWDVIPGAESMERFDARTWPAVERIAAAHGGQRVVVVSHGGVIAHLLHRATGSRPFAFVDPDNASISEVVAHDGRWTIRRFNDIAHLD